MCLLQKASPSNQWMSCDNFRSTLKFAMGQWGRIQTSNHLWSLERIKNETNSRLVGSSLVTWHKVRLFYNQKPTNPILSSYNVLVFLFLYVHFKKQTNKQEKKNKREKQRRRRRRRRRKRSGLKIFIWSQSNFHLKMMLPNQDQTGKRIKEPGFSSQLCPYLCVLGLPLLFSVLHFTAK